MEQDDVEPPEEPEPVHVPEESTRVLAGYKATLTSKCHPPLCGLAVSPKFPFVISDPYTSAKAKAHAEEVLQAAGIHERHPGHTDDEHQTRVLAGYKASLHSMSPFMPPPPSSR